jgi:hypothetical protein
VKPNELEPRDATRGGVNFAALPRKRGRESPLSIDQNADTYAFLMWQLGME